MLEAFLTTTALKILLFVTNVVASQSEEVWCSVEQREEGRPNFQGKLETSGGLCTLTS